MFLSIFIFFSIRIILFYIKYHALLHFSTFCCKNCQWFPCLKNTCSYGPHNNKHSNLFLLPLVLPLYHFVSPFTKRQPPFLQFLLTSVTITAHWIPPSCSTQSCLSTLQIFLAFGKYSSVILEIKLLRSGYLTCLSLISPLF